MKVKITCPKCRSTNIAITSDGKAKKPTPMYKCNNCGYTHSLFPKMWEDKEDKENDEEE